MCIKRLKLKTLKKITTRRELPEITGSQKPDIQKSANASEKSMNLCNTATLRVIENGLIVSLKNKSTYLTEEHYFETLEKAFEFLKDYWKECDL